MTCVKTSRGVDSRLCSASAACSNPAVLFLQRDRMNESFCPVLITNERTEREGETEGGVEEGKVREEREGDRKREKGGRKGGKRRKRGEQLWLTRKGKKEGE